MLFRKIRWLVVIVVMGYLVGYAGGVAIGTHIAEAEEWVPLPDPGNP